MWNETADFENQLASYWEDEEESDARTLTSDPDKRTDGAYKARNDGRRLFKRVQRGLSFGSHNVKRGNHAA